MKKLFQQLQNLWRSIWGELPQNYEADTEQLITYLNEGKTLLTSPAAATLEKLFPNGIGTVIGDALVALINKILPTLEIGKECEDAVAAYILSNPGATDTQKADVVIQTILANLSQLPASWQGKHWEDIAVTLLEEVLQISTTEAKALLNVKYGELQATKA